MKRRKVPIGGGGGSSKSRQQTYVDPYQIGHLRNIYDRAEQLSKQPRSFYPEKSYVPYSAETESALSGMYERSRSGSPIVQGAQQYTQDVLAGRYSDPSSNPYLQATYDAAARTMGRHFKTNVVPGAYASAYGRGGSGVEANRFSSAYDRLGQNLGELATNIYGGNYQAERGRMEAAAGRAPGLADYDYRDLAQMRAVGGEREDLAGRELQDLMARYYFQFDEPRQRLGEYSEFVGQPTVLSKGKSSSFNANASVLWG